MLRVVAAARPLSQRVVHVAQAATALGVLLALVGGRRRGKTHALAPVHTSALVGLFQGARAGHRATRGRAPAPAVHVQWHALDPDDVLDRLSEAASNGRRRSVRRTLAEVGERGRALADKPLPRRVLAPARGTVALSSAMREELQDPLTPVLALGAHRVGGRRIGSWTPCWWPRCSPATPSSAARSGSARSRRCAS